MVSLKKLPIVSDVKISYLPKMKVSEMPSVKNSAESYPLFLDKWNLDTINLFEEFKIMLLTHGGKVKGIYPLAMGGITGVVVDPEIIILAAILGVSKGIVLCHNHPSGSLQPSKTDLEMTQQVKLGAKLFNIKVNDHLIISLEGYYSFADNGLM